MSGVHQNACHRAVQSLLSISYIVLALPSTLTKLSNKTLIFHDFQGPTINFYDFPGLENELLKFQDFPGFQRHVQTLPHRMKISGGGRSKAKVPSVGKNPLPISLLINYFSLKIKFVHCHHQRVKISEVAKFENTRLSSVNKSESSWHNHFHGQSKHHK